MTVYRISKGTYSNDLSGKGAELHGGRWNSKGTALLYTAQSRALAYAEISMHLPMGVLPKDYFLTSILIPEKATWLAYSETDLPDDWRSYPHPDSTQKMGDAFAQSLKDLVMQVPSAVVPGDFNFLINPLQPQIAGVKVLNIEPFEFDSRFAGRGQA